MTIVKGTFPVRFRRDGKDGVNTWLKYAKELDVFDESTEKYYPSKMYDTSSEDCIYIGLGKGVGDEPTDPRYYTWNKWKGDDGTSFTAKGQAVAHHASLSAYNSATKSTGLHLVDNTGGALLKYWNGSATTDRTCEDGDAYTTSDKHLWIKDGATWNDLGEIQGPKGDNAYLHYITVNSYSNDGSTCQNALISVHTEDGKSNTTGGSGGLAGRGLTLWAISKTGTSIAKYGTYDTWGDATAADRMAQSIESGIVGSDAFLAVTSHDACGFSANLIAALKKWGGGDIADYTPKRQAFSFLGYKGMPEGTAQQVLNIGEDKQASIYALVNNGICQGKGQDGRSIKSIVNEYQRHGKGDDDNKPTGAWSESSPELNYEYPFLWRRQTITYTDGSNYVDIRCIGKIGDKGIDGNGSDFAYYLSASSAVPTAPSEPNPITFNPSSITPNRWTDDSQGVSEQYPYEFISEMKMVNGEWKGYGTPSLWAKYSEDGATGHGWVASVDRDKKFTEAQWGTYGTPGHTETWTDTSSIRNGCRIGDIFLVWGNATDTGKGHNAFYRCTNSSGNLAGTCISHTVSPKGDKGDDAYSYKLSSSISALPLNNDGSPQKTSFTLQAYMFKGTSSLKFNASDNYQIVVFIVHSGSTTPITRSVTLSSDVSSMTVELKDDNGNIINNITEIQCNLYRGQAKYESFSILPVKAGAAGVSYFPNNRGNWESGQTYYWTGMSRDMVTYNINGTPYLFAVKTAGTSTNNCPVKSDGVTTNEGWEKADSPFSMLFANFVYTDNASVAGFIWSDLKMKSPNGKLILNGNTGEIDAVAGRIGGISISSSGISALDSSQNGFILHRNGTLFANRAVISGNITATSGTFDNCTINETCKAGFMNYSANKLNGNVINCGLINYNDIGGPNDTTLYLPSVADGEFKKIIVMNFRATKSIVGNYTLAIEGGGRFHDFNNFPIIGGQIYPSTFTIEEGVYYEFVGIYKGGYTRWICVNRDLPRI